MLEAINAFDIRLFYAINRGQENALFDVLMPIVSNLELFYVPIGLFWLFLVVRGGIKGRCAALAILAVIAFSEWTSSGLLKPTFERPRPYHAVGNVHLYDRVPQTWSLTPDLETPVRGRSQSLPSAHATNIFAAAFFLSFYFRRFWPLFYLIAIAVGYSRIYLGVHFPLDVLAGAGVGSLCALLFVWPCNRAIVYFQDRSVAPSAGGDPETDR